MMQPVRVVHREEEKEEDQEFVSKKDTPFSNSRDGKNNDKASAMRSKHSVTEQRRRCKINERFQMLRDLIPHSDQKRDTASFLLEVIEYVQYLQEKVQKYEGSYQGWSSEPTKLTPWRNSHWRVQSFSGHPQGTKNGSGGSVFAGRFDDSNISSPPAIHPNQQNPIESDSGRDTSGKTVDELANKSVGMPIPLQVSVPTSIQGASALLHPVPRPFSDAQSTESPVTTDSLNQLEDLIIEGGSISITSVYSEGLLNNLTQALQSAGIDLSQATVSVQIDLGKRANRGLTPSVSIHKDPENTTVSGQPMGHFRDDVRNGEGADQAQKRLKT